MSINEAVGTVVNAIREFDQDAAVTLYPSSDAVVAAARALAREVDEQTPVARRSDPHQSWLAARNVNAGTVAHGVLSILHTSGLAIADQSLVRAYRNRYDDGRGRPTAESTIRTRRAELVRAGYVRQDGETGHGRVAALWRVTPEGSDHLAMLGGPRPAAE